MTVPPLNEVAPAAFGCTTCGRITPTLTACVACSPCTIVEIPPVFRTQQNSTKAWENRVRFTCGPLEVSRSPPCARPDGNIVDVLRRAWLTAAHGAGRVALS